MGCVFVVHFDSTLISKIYYFHFVIFQLNFHFMIIKSTMSSFGKTLYLKCYKCHLRTYIKGQLKEARSKLYLDKSVVKYQVHVGLHIKGSKPVRCYCIRRAMINLQEKSVQTVSSVQLLTFSPPSPVH